MKAVKNKQIKNYYLMIAAVVCIALFIAAWLLRSNIAALEKNNLQNKAALNKALPDFNLRSPDAVKRQIQDLKSRLTGLSAVFDTKYKWIKKDYDLSIYFVEELGNARQFLKQKAQEKQVAAPELGFKEKLPSGQEASLLLSQLYGLKEVISLGMDYGINFKTVAPDGVEEAKVPGIKLVKSRIALSCPAQGLIEFIIQLNEIIPKVCFEALSLKSQGDSYDMDLTLEQVVVETELNGKQEQPSPAEIKEVAGKEDENFIHILRSNNPFFVPETKIPLSASSANASPEPEKKQVRFIYRGTATLKSKQVVVVEDLLNKETVFLGLNDKVANFVLTDFSDSQITLKNTDDNQELIINREEK
ncbi:MAG: hypothetical protein ACM3IL_02490 [Deltaproteobacteria bacterium]